MGAEAPDPAFYPMGVERDLEMLECAQHIPVERGANREEPPAMIDGQRMAGDRPSGADRLCLASDQGDKWSACIALRGDPAANTNRHSGGAVEQW